MQEFKDRAQKNMYRKLAVFWSFSRIAIGHQLCHIRMTFA
jgi:hypothetical protein